MERIGIISFNSASFTEKMEEAKEVEIVKLDVEIAGESFVDKSIEELMDATVKYKEIPKTSQPTTDSYLVKYEEMLGKYKDILVLTPDKELSGTHSGSLVARSMLDDDKAKRIHIVETRSFAISEALLCDMAIDLIREGKSMEEIIPVLENLAKNITTYIIPGSFDHLRMSGRVSIAKSMVGKLMMLKLLIKHKDGVAEVYKKGRGFKKLLKLVSEEIDSKPNIKKIYIASLDANPAEYNLLKELLESKHELVEAKIGSVVVAAHFGSQTLGFLLLEG